MTPQSAAAPALTVPPLLLEVFKQFLWTLCFCDSLPKILAHSAVLISLMRKTGLGAVTTLEGLLLNPQISPPPHSQLPSFGAHGTDGSKLTLLVPLLGVRTTEHS